MMSKGLTITSIASHNFIQSIPTQYAQQGGCGKVQLQLTCEAIIHLSLSFLDIHFSHKQGALHDTPLEAWGLSVTQWIMV